MGTATEKLRFLFESSGAHGVVGDFKKIDDAGDSTKTKMGGVGDTLKGLGSAAVVGGVGAVAAAAFAAVGKFEQVALAAGKFSDATGVSVEQSSRWIEVAGDMGIESGTVESALGKLNKTIGASPEKLKALGVEVQHTKDGAVDVNATFLTLVDRLNGITDPAEQAKVATATLGKGWQSMAELIGEGSTKLKASLAEVSDAKVISPDELEKAKKYRDAMDTLHDSFEDLAITAGQNLAPAFAQAAKQAAEVVKQAKPLLQLAGVLTVGFTDVDKATEKWGRNGIPFVAQTLRLWDKAFSTLPGQQDKATESIDRNASATSLMGDAIRQANAHVDVAIDTFGGLNTALMEEEQAFDRAEAAARKNAVAMARAETATRDMANAQRAVKQALAETNREWDELTGAIDDDEAWLSLQDQAAATGEAIKKAFDPKHTVDDVRAAEHAVNALKDQVAGYGREVLAIPAEQVTTMFALIDKGSMTTVLDQLAILTRNRQINLEIVARGGPGYIGRKPGAKGASGAIVTRPTYAEIGEAGPEAVIPLNRMPGASPLGALGGGAGTLNVHVHVHSFTPPNPVDTGRIVADALSRFIRSGGRVPGVQLSGTNNN